MDEDNGQPLIVKQALAALGLSAVGGLALSRFVDWKLVVLVLVVFILLFGAHFFWRWSGRRRRSAKFMSAVEAESAGAIGQGSAEAKRALDDLRKRFQGGVEEFRRISGKDLYYMPWYVIMGESGAGKTEAVRAALKDAMPQSLKHHVPGPGGTVNMNWWFTYQAVILDTAGRMVVPEKGQSADSSEWREFLRLLRKARPHHPINGVLFVLSAESLIKDSAERISEKAGKLNQQLDLIQQTLDVRFPVYLMITKCDLLTGFREFCDEITEPSAQQQMLGWSNPDGLDTPFRPGLVEEHLNEVAARIRRRRLALLTESVGATTHFETTTAFPPPAGFMPPHALDARDSLFALPDSLCRLAPRLKRYLETIFEANAYRPKPVFLRGIYFSSSMRQGGALDEALALATGLPLDQVAAVHPVTESRAFFLEDMFKEKVFPEQKLVTRHRNTQKVLRQRKLAVYGTATAVLFGLLGFAWYSNHDLRRTIQGELELWEFGAKGWTGDEWRPNQLATNDGGWKYLGNQPLRGKDAPKLTAEEFHLKLAELARTNLSPGWVFAPMVVMTKRGLDEREPAQRRLFDAGIVRPLIQRVRHQMSTNNLATGDAGALEPHSAALAALIRLERGLTSGVVTEGEAVNQARTFLEPYFQYLFREPAPEPIVDVFALTYTESGPALRSGGATLSENRAIGGGLKTLKQASQLALTNVNQRLQALTNLTGALERYRDAESNWLVTARSTPALALTNYHQVLGSAWTNVEVAKRSAARPVLEVGGETRTNWGTSLEQEFGLLEVSAQQVSGSILTNILASLGSDTERSGLVAEIHDAVINYSSDQGKTVRDSWERLEESSKDLDQRFLAQTSNLSVMEVRRSWYDAAVGIASHPVTFSIDDVGKGWSSLATLGSLGLSLPEYDGPLSVEATQAAREVAAAAVKRLQETYARNYADEVARLLDEASRPESLRSGMTNMISLIRRVDYDLKTNCPPEIKDPLSRRMARARSDVVTAYVELRKQGLAAADRFPANLRGKTNDVLTVEQLSTLRTALEDTKGELESFFGGVLEPGERDTLNQGLEPHLRRLGVLNAILGKQGPLDYEIQIAGLTTESPDVYRYAVLEIGANRYWVDLYGLSAEAPSRSWSLSMTNSPLIGVYRDTATRAAALKNGVNPQATGAPWGMLANLGNPLDKEDRKTWLVDWKAPVDSSGETVDIKLRLILPVSLPPKEEW